jgi:hypothetical protein
VDKGSTRLTSWAYRTTLRRATETPAGDNLVLMLAHPA